MSHAEVDTTSVGILLPEFSLKQERVKLQVLMKQFIESSSSRAARELLISANPSRAISDGSSKRLVEVEGPSLPKDPHTEAVRRYAKAQGWSTPTVEDALLLFGALTQTRFNQGAMKCIVVMHAPIKNHVLGITFDRGSIVLSAHKAEPREGWFCKQVGFAFRSN